MLPFQQIPRLLLLLQTVHLLSLLVQASTLRELATAGGSNDFDSQLTAGNSQQTQQMLLSKRAFDRLDVSPFDFNKRFFDQEETPLAKLFTRPSMLTQPKGRRIRQRPSSSSSLSSAPARRRMARVHGFGLFGPAKFKRRAEPVVERQKEPYEMEEAEQILILY